MWVNSKGGKLFSGKIHLDFYNNIHEPHNNGNTKLSLLWIYYISSPACDCFDKARPRDFVVWYSS